MQRTVAIVAAVIVSAEIASASPIGISIVSTADVIAVGPTTTDDPAVVTSTGSTPVGSFSSGDLLAVAASFDAKATALASLETSWTEVSADHFTLSTAGSTETHTSTSDTYTGSISAAAQSSVEFTFTLVEPYLFFTIGEILGSSGNAEALYTLSLQGGGDVFALSSSNSPVPFDFSGSLPAGTYILLVSQLPQSTASGPSQFMAGGGYFDIGIDLVPSGSNPTPTPVPEPGTLMLLGAGIGGMAARGLRPCTGKRRE